MYTLIITIFLSLSLFQTRSSSLLPSSRKRTERVNPNNNAYLNKDIQIIVGKGRQMKITTSKEYIIIVQQSNM